jgi:hypothetical protein
VTSLPGAGGGHTADSDAFIVRKAFVWGQKGDNDAAEAALKRLEAAANRTAEAERLLHERSMLAIDSLAAAEAERDAAHAALRALVAAVEPLMASKPVELMKDGLMRYDWTDALYAIQKAIGPARAALGGPE